MDVLRYPGLRVKAFTVPSSQEKVQTFYARAWPGIHWVKQGEGHSALAGLIWDQLELRPVADPAPFAEAFEKAYPPSGMLLVLSTDDEMPGRTRVLIVNFRRS